MSIQLCSIKPDIGRKLKKHNTGEYFSLNILFWENKVIFHRMLFVLTPNEFVVSFVSDTEKLFNFNFWYDKYL